MEEILEFLQIWSIKNYSIYLIINSYKHIFVEK